MQAYFKSLIAPILLTLFFLPFAMSAPDRRLPEPVKPKSKPVFAGKWREAGCTYEVSTLDGKRIKMAHNAWPANAEWDGKQLVVSWTAYHGCYEWDGEKMIGWYCFLNGGLMTKDTLVPESLLP